VTYLAVVLAAVAVGDWARLGFVVEESVEQEFAGQEPGMKGLAAKGFAVRGFAVCFRLSPAVDSLRVVEVEAVVVVAALRQEWLKIPQAAESQWPSSCLSPGRLSKTRQKIIFCPGG
jgi:hypothetical protein